ncbi:MAG: efflux RND transporter periplasmic adaptor subunit, partial [Candidatus Neomarinimicrobiota bacterium]|nr:efflux RND transporter periplasmic adaptor subunit [Candidatus Neomarinimicrobiota bacterium]
MLKKLKQKKIWIPLLVIILSGTGYWIMNSSEDGEISVQAEEVIRRDIIHKVNANGKIQPEEEVQISSTITAWITSITVAEGDTVQPGQLLISMDEKQYRAAYNQTLSGVKSAEANLKQVKAQKERTESLYEKNLISKQELEQIEASFELASSQVDQAQSSLLSREDELSKTKLLAPAYGIVTSLTKEVGEMAVGGMFNPGVVMTIADLTRMEVLVDVNENDVVTVMVGDTAEIEVDAFPDTIFYGVVSEIAHTAQSMNLGSQEQVTNFKVKVKMIDPPGNIRPGMSSTVNIITEVRNDAISIPIQSLTARSENYKSQSKRKAMKKKGGRKKDKGGRRKTGDGASAGKGKGGWKKDKMIEVV